mgnify:CR=1 FL=1
MIHERPIIFLEPFPTVPVYKIARLFKERGYKTISLRILESKGLSDDFYKDAFDRIISFKIDFSKINKKSINEKLRYVRKNQYNFRKVLSHIKKLKPYVIIARAEPSLPCALMKIALRKTPFVYFPYDIRSQAFKTIKEAKKRRGVNKWEIWAERFCFEHSDGIMHKGDSEELKYLNGSMLGDNIKLARLQISFLPYCSKEFIVPINKNKLSKKDKETHLVFIGSIGSVNPSACNYLLEYFEGIIKQKIHIHLYTQPNTQSKEEMVSSFKNIWAEIIKSKYFHLHEPLGPKEIIKEISKYDYGLWPLDYKLKNPKITLEPKLATGNKLSSYLEAGIPFFNSPDHEFADKLMEKYGLSLHFGDLDDTLNLKDRIKKADYRELEKKVIKMRKEFDMDRNFPRLERFIKAVVAKKKAQ